MSVVIGIDPGPADITWVAWNGKQIIEKGLGHPRDLAKVVLAWHSGTIIAIEGLQIYSSGGRNTIVETAQMIGMVRAKMEPREVIQIYRSEVKRHHLGSVKGSDSDIKAALCARFGEDNPRKCTGVLAGLKGTHEWSSFAVALAVHDQWFLGDSGYSKAMCAAILRMEGKAS